MASLIVLDGKGDSEIYYSIVDGVIYGFTLHGDELYNKLSGRETDGWKDRLVEFVKELVEEKVLHNPRHAFFLRLAEEGLVEFSPADDDEAEFTMGSDK